jgi:hypothetical protein
MVSAAMRHTSPPDRRIARLLFLGLWAIYALIGPGASAVNPNVISRLGFVFAVLEEGTPRIDRFAGFTVDKAEFEGHTYLDKAPGLSLMTLPVIAAVRGLALAAGSAFALATPAFGWSTTFFSHAVTGGLLFAGFASVVLASAPEPRRPLACAAAAGLLLGWAIVVEFTAAAPAAAIVLAGLWRLRARPDLRLPVLLTATGTGVLAAIPLVLYNVWCFGDPFRLGYSNVVGFDGMRTGLFGISLPRPDRHGDNRGAADPARDQRRLRLLGRRRLHRPAPPHPRAALRGPRLGPALGRRDPPPPPRPARPRRRQLRALPGLRRGDDGVADGRRNPALHLYLAPHPRR